MIVLSLRSQLSIAKHMQLEYGMRLTTRVHINHLHVEFASLMIVLSLRSQLSISKTHAAGIRLFQKHMHLRKGIYKNTCIAIHGFCKYRDLVIKQTKGLF
jgi:hypothetical protein